MVNDMAEMGEGYMKTALRRVALLALALALMVGAVAPVALAAEQIRRKGTTFTAEKMITYTGMKTSLTVYDADGNAKSPSSYKWESKSKKIAKVSSGGVVTAQKPGTTKIVATSKANKKDSVSIKITVKKNTATDLCSKPSTSIIPRKEFALVLKSVEIASPKKVVAKYYYVQNYPSSWRGIKLNYVKDRIYAWDDETNSYKTLVEGKVSKSISISARGKKVKTIKVTFSGSKVKTTDICLKDCYGDVFSDIKYLKASLKCSHPV